MPVLPGGTVVDEKGKVVEAKDPGTIDKAIQGAEEAVARAVVRVAKDLWGRTRPGQASSSSEVSAEEVDDEEQEHGTAQPDKVVGRVDNVVRSRRSIPRPPTLTKDKPRAKSFRTHQPTKQGSGQRLQRLLPTRRQGRVQIGHDEHGFALRILGQDELFERFRRRGFEVTGTSEAFEVWGPAPGIPFRTREEALAALRQVKRSSR